MGVCGYFNHLSLSIKADKEHFFQFQRLFTPFRSFILHRTKVFNLCYRATVVVRYEWFYVNITSVDLGCKYIKFTHLIYQKCIRFLSI